LLIACQYITTVDRFIIYERYFEKEISKSGIDTKSPRFKTEVFDIAGEYFRSAAAGALALCNEGKTPF